MLISGQVIGLSVTVGSTDCVAEAILRKAGTGQGGYVCVSNVHMLTTAKQNEALRKIIEAAAWVTADGLPLVWVLKRKGFREAERVTGTDLTLRLCKRSAEEGMSVGFYGSSLETIRALQKSITSRFPTLKVAVYESPPPAAHASGNGSEGGESPQRIRCMHHLCGAWLSQAGILDGGLQAASFGHSHRGRCCFRFHRRHRKAGAPMGATRWSRMAASPGIRPRKAVETLCDNEYGVYLDGDEGVFYEEVEMRTDCHDA